MHLERLAGDHRPDLLLVVGEAALDDREHEELLVRADDDELPVGARDLLLGHPREDLDLQELLGGEADDVGDPAPPGTKLHLGDARVLLLVEKDGTLPHLGGGKHHGGDGCPDGDGGIDHGDTPLETLNITCCCMLLL